MTPRVVFAGSPAVAVPYLRALCDGGFDVVTVITREDAPVGRKRVLTATAVAVEAERRGIPVIKSNSLRDTDIPAVDVGVVVAYGGLVPSRLLSVPAHGWVNVHFSQLPEYRGAAPVQRALWDGRSDAGISIFRLVEELDAGPVFFSRSIPFEPLENATDALHRIAEETTRDLIDTLGRVIAGSVVATPQSGTPTFAPKFRREDARISWSDGTVRVINTIRAVTREPGAYTTLNSEPFGIVSVGHSHVEGSVGAPGEVSTAPDGVFVGTGDGSIELLVVKPFGKPSMTAADWVRGLRAPAVFE